MRRWGAALRRCTCGGPHADGCLIDVDEVMECSCDAVKHCPQHGVPRRMKRRSRVIVKQKIVVIHHHHHHGRRRP